MLNTRLCLLLICSGINCALPPHNDWDVLLFVQHWLPTACQEYMLKNASDKCVSPSNPDSWTVHGIWPTKLGTKGPNKCNKTWTLQPHDIKSLKDQLVVTWSDIFQDESFNKTIWAHEWLNHGTCAATIKNFQQPTKYFQQGIAWNKQYNMTSILEKANIVSSDDKTYNLDDIYKAIKSSVGKEPHIGCLIVDGSKQYISELRICFNKSLKLIDCGPSTTRTLNVPPGRGRKTDSLGFTTNCDTAVKIIYPVKFGRGKSV